MNTASQKLRNGTMNTISDGDISIRVYDTADAIQDQVIIVDRQGEGVVIELPAFRESVDEVTGYLEDEGIRIVGKLVSYHAAGASFLPDVKSYLTPSAARYNTDGQGAGLVESFSGIFGDAFDSGIVNKGEVLEAGTVRLAGIDLEIIPNADAYEVVIPAMNAVYIHMLGHDCHSIVAGPEHADAIVASLRGYLDRGIETFLSSHYVPETRQDAETKIAYIEDLKAIAASSGDADGFKAKVKSKYPDYSGEKYLDMTAGFFFPQ